MITRTKDTKVSLKNHSTLEFTVKSGIASVNLFTGSFMFNHPDLEVGENSFKISIFHIYHSHLDFIKSNMGKHWKLSCEEFIFPYQTAWNLPDFVAGDYVYVDAQGYLHRMAWLSADTFYDKSGLGLKLKLTTLNGKRAYELYDLHENQRIFNAEGSLVSFIQKQYTHTYYATAFEYNECNQLVKIYDGRHVTNQKIKRYIALEYTTDNLLNKMSVVADETVLESIYYGYDGQNLIYTAKYISNALKTATAFSHDKNGYLQLLSSTGADLGLKMSYEAHKVIKVTKGAADVVVADHLNFLADGTFAGDVAYSSNNYRSVQIGRTKISDENIADTHAFVDDHMYLSDVLTQAGIYVEGATDDHTQQLISKSDIESKWVEFTNFHYISEKSTEISNHKLLRYQYSFNKKGFTTGAFEIGKAGYLHTLTKDGGVSLMSDVKGKGINTTPIVSGKSQDKLYLYKEFQQYINGFVFPNFYDFRKHKQNEKTDYYALSFWIKHQNNSLNELKMYYKVLYDGQDERGIFEEESFVYLDPAAYDVWQHITIPISKGDNGYSTIIKEVYLLLEGSQIDYEISNMSVSTGTSDRLVLNTRPNEDIRKAYAFDLITTSNELTTLFLNGQDFITNEDMLYNLKQILKKGSTDFMYASLTKCIPNIKAVHVKYLSGYQPTYPLYLYNILYINQFPESTSKTEKRWQYTSSSKELKEITKVLIKNHDTVESTVIYDSKDRLVESIDTYGVKTVHQYDTYGNLLKTVKALQTDFDETGRNVKAACDRVEVNHTYAPAGKQAEYVKKSISLGNDQVETDRNRNLQPMLVKRNRLNPIKLSYDHINQLTGMSSLNGTFKEISHAFSYDEAGRLKTVTDDDRYQFGFEYDDYGNLTKYTIDSQDGKTVLKEKSYPITTLSQGYSTLNEKNYQTQTNTSVILDQYSRNLQSSIQLRNAQYAELVFDYQKQGEKINQGKFASRLNESFSLAKLKSVSDGFTNTNHTFTYNDDNELCGYQVLNNGQNHISVEQMYANEVKYQVGQDKSKVKVNYNKNAAEPRVSSMEYYFDPNSDQKDEWTVAPYLKTTYQYHKVLGSIEKKERNFTNGNSEYYVRTSYVDDFSYQKIGKQFTGKISQHKAKLEYKWHAEVNEENGQPAVLDVTNSENLYEYTYDENGNTTTIKNTGNVVSASINQSNRVLHQFSRNTSYEYDSFNRILTESNTQLSLNNRYYYYNPQGKYLNRITKVVDKYNASIIKKSLSYDHLNRLTEYRKDGQLRKKYTYASNMFVPSLVTVGQTNMNLTWERDQLLTKYGSNEYRYDYNSVRFSKKTATNEIKYYYDQDKLMGEDHRDGTRLRYLYDLTGIIGIRKTLNDVTNTYTLIKDVSGNIVWIAKNGIPVIEYNYDAWGNHTKTHLTNDIDNMIDLNPFRWKGHYFDTETNLYYIDGKYYDPEVMQNLGPDDIETVLEGVEDLDGINLYMSMGNNPNKAPVYAPTQNPALDIRMNQNYDPDIGKSWWDLNWQWVIRLGLLGLSVLASAFTGTLAAMIAAASKAAIPGFIIGGIAGAIISGVTGGSIEEGFAKGAINGAIDAFVTTAVFHSLVSVVQCFSRPNAATIEFTSKQLDIDPESLRLAQEGNPKFDTFRKRVWQNEVKIPGKYDPDDISNMIKGLAPLGKDGYPINLHHINGRGDLYNVVALQRTHHIQYHKAFGYHMSERWQIVKWRKY